MSPFPYNYEAFKRGSISARNNPRCEDDGKLTWYAATERPVLPSGSCALMEAPIFTSNFRDSSCWDITAWPSGVRPTDNNLTITGLYRHKLTSAFTARGQLKCLPNWLKIWPTNKNLMITGLHSYEHKLTTFTAAINMHAKLAKL